jgi:hypothetical protein
LTVIPKHDIKSKGIPYVRSKIDEKGSTKAWSQFWSYFVNTWMTSYDPSWWNVNEMIAADVDITNRTNNPLEWYNHHYQHKFPNPHPSPYLWLQLTKKKAMDHVLLIDQVKKT